MLLIRLSYHSIYRKKFSLLIVHFYIKTHLCTEKAELVLLVFTENIRILLLFCLFIYFFWQASVHSRNKIFFSFILLQNSFFHRQIKAIFTSVLDYIPFLTFFNVGFLKTILIRLLPAYLYRFLSFFFFTKIAFVWIFYSYPFGVVVLVSLSF